MGTKFGPTIRRWKTSTSVRPPTRSSWRRHSEQTRSVGPRSTTSLRTRRRVTCSWPRTAATWSRARSPGSAAFDRWHRSCGSRHSRAQRSPARSASIRRCRRPPQRFRRRPRRPRRWRRHRCDSGDSRLDVVQCRQLQQPGHSVMGVRVQRRGPAVGASPARLRRPGHHHGQLRVEFEPQAHHHLLSPGVYLRVRLLVAHVAAAAR